MTHGTMGFAGFVFQPSPDAKTASDAVVGLTAPPKREGSSPAGAIAGGVVGGLAFIAILVAFVFFRRRRRTNDLANLQPDSPPFER
jgi:uncharacterized protein involved in exopolysaccharide biosynthesis